MHKREAQEESTRRAILHFLKTHGHADAKTLAEFCGLTTMAVGKHLLQLRMKKLIEMSWERRPRGRPAAVYFLTEQGDRQFPREYADVAIEVLSSLEEMDGPEKVQQVLEKRRLNLEKRYKIATKGTNLKTRAHQVADLLTEGGYMARVDAARGACRLTLCNCAIREVAKAYPAACEEELRLIRNLLKTPYVERVQHVLAGDRHCSYRIGRRERPRSGKR